MNVAEFGLGFLLGCIATIVLQLTTVVLVARRVAAVKVREMLERVTRAEAAMLEMLQERERWLARLQALGVDPDVSDAPSRRRH